MTWASPQKAHLSKDTGHALIAAFLGINGTLWHLSALPHFPYFLVKAASHLESTCKRVQVYVLYTVAANVPSEVTSHCSALLSL